MADSNAKWLSLHPPGRIAAGQVIDLGHGHPVEVPGIVCLSALAATPKRSAAFGDRPEITA
jgi:hypothetical protein